MKKPKSHLFTVKHGQNEFLKDYIARFNAEALLIDGGNDDLSLSAMMSGLKPSKLLWSVGKNDPKDYQDLLSRAQKYANAEELMNSRRSEGYAKSGEKKKKGPDQQPEPKRAKSD